MRVSLKSRRHFVCVLKVEIRPKPSKMGVIYSNMYDAYITSPETEPNRHKPSVFDPMYGFPNGRKEREMKVSEKEMEAIGLRADQRDYCAHHLVDFYKCRRDYFPFVAACSDIKHQWDGCQYNDFVIRMKEYEREKRLLKRAKRKGELENREEMLSA